MGGKRSTKRSKHSSESEEADKTKKYKIKGKKSKKNTRTRKVLKVIGIALVILIIIGAGVFAGIFFGLFGDDFKITKDDLLITKTNSVVKDSDGNIIANLAGDENRKVISKDEMPEYLPKAFVSIEDERFYKHHGVDIKRTAAATVTYVFNRGNSSFGGSTITQQLIKNLTNEKDDSGVKGMIRKVKEMSKAYQVEKLISKDQILELYLNIIFLGDKAYGVEVASQYYFSKSAKDLDLAECAFLAGINHSPNGYKPFEEYVSKEDPASEKQKMQDKIKKRTKTVLTKMKELGAITSDEEYNTAVAEVENGLNFKKGEIATSGSGYSYHTAAAINQVKKDLIEKNGWSEELADINLRNNGYVIYSTQNTSIQNRMEEEFKKDTTYIRIASEVNKEGVKEKSQAAMVIIDHTNGQVVGTVGGLGSNSNASGLNRATQSYRQTGSSMKPLSVVAPGLEKNVLTAGTVYFDGKTVFGGGYTPKNDSGTFKNNAITIRDAIEISQNIPQLKAMTDLGPANSVKFLKEIGFSKIVSASENKKANDESLSLALGGLTNGASPLEMAAGYAMIANNGEYISPTFYTKVEDKNGKTVIEAKQEKKRALSEQNAYILKSILTEPVTGSAGTATYCKIAGMDVSAKTGTTNDNKDRWLCGFTPYYAAATWYGYDTPSEVRFSGRNPAGRIWSSIMQDIHKNLSNKKFEKPNGIVTATICKDTGLLAGSKCTDTYTEIFKEGTVPTKKCEGRVTVKICTETGKIATEYCPSEEKYYTVKPPKEETGNWKTDYNGKYGNPPTDTCTVHTKPVEVPKEPEKPVDNTTGNTTGGNTVDGNTAGGNTTDGNTAGGNTVDENTTNGRSRE